MQCTYKLTSRGVGLTIVAVEKQNVLHTLSVCLQLFYPACNAHAPYYIVIYGVSGSTIFLHIIL